MSILIGMICLLFMCICIVILSSFPISQYKKKHPIKKTTDYYILLFNVYDEPYPFKKL